jgi:Holliday junction resolvase-like predicted endonuclease
VWRAFDEIIKTSRKNTKKLTEKSLALALKFKMIPFLLGEGMTSELQLQYDLFKKLVAIKVELINYKRNVLESFSFDSTVKYILKNESLSYLNQRNVKDNWLEKHSLLLNYWLIVGSQRLFDSDYIYRILPTGDNLEANAIALSKAFGVKEQLKQIYGIEYLKVDNVHLDLFDVMMTLSLSQAHYLKDHIHKFEQFLSDSNFNLEALSKLMMHGFIIGENRMPMTFALENDKSKKMSSWITEGSNNQKLKQMKKILKFWSFDLYDENDQSTYMQKPFYRIDDFIFQFPWLTAFQNLNTAMINYVRKLHKNRLELKSETDQIELNLAEKLDRIGFQVFCQYVPSEGNAGEIDLIAMYDNHVIVAEVKSTYIRSSIQEIYEYKKFVLNKASYQLDNKVEYIKRHFLSRHFEDINDVIIHSWIIDTTLEFDHEYFGNHLKVSLDEVIITSNCESEFMQKLVDEQFDIEKDEVKIDPIQFLESIEKNTFWSKQLGNYDHYMEKMLSKLAS